MYAIQTETTPLQQPLDWVTPFTEFFFYTIAERQVNVLKYKNGPRCKNSHTHS